MSPPVRLTLFLALMSSVSFGGIPPVLPDIRHFVVAANGWLSDEDFTNFFALAQSIPGPNMILMMALIGWKVGGVPGALAAGGATAVPPCLMYFAGYRLWQRFRNSAWQSIARASLAPLTFGLVVGGGTVMVETVDTTWSMVAASAAAGTIFLTSRVNPLWMLAGAAALGALGLV